MKRVRSIDTVGKRWIKSKRHKCPICDKSTETLVDEEYEYAERCKKCNIIIDFEFDPSE